MRERISSWRRELKGGYNTYTLASIYITHKLYSTLGHLDPCVSLVTTGYYMHIYKSTIRYIFCKWSVHLIYITSTYLYPIPHYTLNHTAYPHTSHTLTLLPRLVIVWVHTSSYPHAGDQWTTRVHLLVCVSWVVMDTMNLPKYSRSRINARGSEAGRGWTIK